MAELWKIFDIQHDKLLHFFWGAVIAFPCVYIFGAWGILITFGFAAGKEIFDVIKGKKFDFLDLLYSMVPSIMYYLIQIA